MPRRLALLFYVDGIPRPGQAPMQSQLLEHSPPPQKSSDQWLVETQPRVKTKAMA